jgi:hypothetical protein
MACCWVRGVQPTYNQRVFQKQRPNTPLHTIITPANTEYTIFMCGSLHAGDTARFNADLIASVDIKVACKMDFMPAGAWVYAYSEPTTEQKIFFHSANDLYWNLDCDADSIRLRVLLRRHASSRVFKAWTSLSDFQLVLNVPVCYGVKLTSSRYYITS